MKTTTPTHPAALGFLAALFSFTLLAPSAVGQESMAATRFTIESNKPQSILLDTTTLEAVASPVYTGKGNFQVRGYDMANITFVYTGSGWLIFDTLMSGECTEAAVALFNEYLREKHHGAFKEVGKHTIAAAIVSHSHIDHYGGLQTLKKFNGDTLLIYAPKGFEQHAMSENLYAGTAMGRHASYQYGTRLEASCCGRISIGIGQGQSKGTVGYLRPTYEVDLYRSYRFLYINNNN